MRGAKSSATSARRSTSSEKAWELIPSRELSELVIYEKRQSKLDRPTEQRLILSLNEIRKRLEATSCTFYVRDPFWPGELRLLHMDGIRIKEPMHGFVFPSTAKRVISHGGPQVFSAYAENNSRLREAQRQSLESIPPENRYLFGDFIEREGVKSSARLIHYEGGQIEAVLFMNYARKEEFGRPLKHELRKALTSLVRGDTLSRLSSELRASEVGTLSESISILTPAHQALAVLPTEPTACRDRELTEYFESLLINSLKALGISPEIGLGTILLFEPETMTLHPAAQVGKIQRKRKSLSASVLSGQGIVSWVAIRRSALLVDDIRKSIFKSIYVPLNDDVKSELAVPLLAGDQLLGVLNLECTRTAAFSPQSVRTVWYAASLAATAYRFYQEHRTAHELKRLSDGLLRLCWEATTNTTDSHAPLNNLATVARDSMRAAKCDIWQYAESRGEFENAGASYPEFDPRTRPRERGWTDFILRSGKPIWICDIEDDLSYKVLYWRDSAWTEEAPLDDLPNDINPRLLDLKVRCELGVPIKATEMQSGVAWLKYDSQVRPPSPYEMALINRLAGQAGLVMELLERREDMVRHDAVQAIGKQLTKSLLAAGQLKLDGFAAIEGHVISRPQHSTIGGDFCASVLIDERTAGILFGDGESHGVTGALNMLPLITTFKAFSKETRSTTHMMDKLMSISRALGVRGTAIYLIFTVIQDRLWLSVTSAGHHSLILIRGNDPIFLPFSDNPACGPMLGVVELTQPLAAQRMELVKDDLLILFTDGVYNSFDAFTHRLDIAKAALGAGSCDPRIVAQAILDQATEGNSTLQDDATVLAIRVI